jgi:hypothetical protein
VGDFYEKYLRFGLVWAGLGWFGLVWAGLGWFGLVWGQLAIMKKQFWADYEQLLRAVFFMF